MKIEIIVVVNSLLQKQPIKWVSTNLIPNTTPCNALQKLGDIWNSFDQGKYDEVGVKGRSLELQREK